MGLILLIWVIATINQTPQMDIKLRFSHFNNLLYFVTEAIFISLVLMYFWKTQFENHFDTYLIKIHSDSTKQESLRHKAATIPLRFFLVSQFAIFSNESHLD